MLTKSKSMTLMLLASSLVAVPSFADQPAEINAAVESNEMSETALRTVDSLKGLHRYSILKKTFNKGTDNEFTQRVVFVASNSRLNLSPTLMTVQLNSRRSWKTLLAKWALVFGVTFFDPITDAMRLHNLQQDRFKLDNPEIDAPALERPIAMTSMPSRDRNINVSSSRSFSSDFAPRSVRPPVFEVESDDEEMEGPLAVAAEGSNEAVEEQPKAPSFPWKAIAHLPNTKTPRNLDKSFRELRPNVILWTLAKLGYFTADHFVRTNVDLVNASWSWKWLFLMGYFSNKSQVNSSIEELNEELFNGQPELFVIVRENLYESVKGQFGNKFKFATEASE